LVIHVDRRHGQLGRSPLELPKCETVTPKNAKVLFATLISFFEDGMLENTIAFGIWLLVIAICGITSAQENAQRLFDHHVHVLSPQLA
jgi:hypothetical protein